MTDCSAKLDELTHSAEIVLNEDLAALQKMQERSRIERYNEIKANEEELLWDFSKECADFITDSELDHLRGELRLARLLLAASFYDEGELPPALGGDFIEAELQAVAEFDRYKQFDALSDDQIEERIRRMEGEVYELVTEYTSTQIANMDELIDNPDVQQDVIERLVDRYDDRREKIRQGFFVYVETHGIEHMVEAIEEAVTAVSKSAETRETIREDLENELSDLSETLNDQFRQQRQELNTRIQNIEQQVASRSADTEELRAELDQLRNQAGAFSRAEAEAIEELNAQIERTAEMEERLDAKIQELDSVRESAANAEREAAREEAAELVESELAELQSERSRLQTEIERLRNEREQIESAHETMGERQEELESRVEEMETSFDSPSEGGEGGLAGDNVVTASIAPLLEQDYLGRFDITMEELDEVYTPDGPFEVPDGYWNNRSERWSERPRLSTLLDDNDDHYAYPTNQTARYELVDSRYLGLSKQRRMVIEAVVFSHLEAYANNGFDTRPADLDDLLGLVNETVYEAEEGEYTHLLAIASPTGWTDRVRQQVQTDDIARARFSQYVSVCLVDLQEDELIYDESDPIVQENAPLFEPPIDAERVSSCVSFIREKYIDDPTSESVLLNDIVWSQDYQPHVVKRAFNQIENNGWGDQLYVDDMGLALYLS
jgi:hypothetical protein